MNLLSLNDHLMTCTLHTWQSIYVYIIVLPGYIWGCPPHGLSAWHEEVHIWEYKSEEYSFAALCMCQWFCMLFWCCTSNFKKNNHPWSWNSQHPAAKDDLICTSLYFTIWLDWPQFDYKQESMARTSIGTSQIIVWNHHYFGPLKDSVWQTAQARQVRSILAGSRIAFWCNYIFISAELLLMRPCMLAYNTITGTAMNLKFAGFDVNLWPSDSPCTQPSLLDSALEIQFTRNCSTENWIKLCSVTGHVTVLHSWSCESVQLWWSMWSYD